MPVVINTNVASLRAQKNLGYTQTALGVSFNRLSSGYRITDARDDAAGLAVSESMRSQIRSYFVVERNANDAISMAQTADGALSTISDIIIRMRELAMNAANGVLQSADRVYLETEFFQLQTEISRMMNSARFNNIPLISGSSTTIVFQVGINNVASDRISLTFGGLMLTQLLGTGTMLSGPATNAQAALDIIDAAVRNLSHKRADYGAVMNRLENTVSNIQTMRVNISSANSRIRDVDVAEETAALSRQQVLAQAGSSILAQANQVPQMALSLLRG